MKKFVNLNTEHGENHFLYCKKYEAPFVSIAKYNKLYYFIEISTDSISLDLLYDRIDIKGEYTINLSEFLEHKLSDNCMVSRILQDIGVCKDVGSHCELGGNYWSVIVRKEYAEKVATFLYDLYSQYINQYIAIKKGIIEY